MEHIGEVNIYTRIKILFQAADVDESLVQGVCPPNFKCKNTPQLYSCECPTNGFSYREEGNGTIKKCLGKLPRLF